MVKSDDIVKRILQAIEESGYSQREFARKSGIAENLISDWRRGAGKPSMASIRKVADGSKKNLNWFFDNSIKDVAINTGSNSATGRNASVGTNNSEESKFLKKENSLLRRENKFLREQLEAYKEADKKRKAYILAEK
ncbi:MAG: helix-turn-helix domain-containing protein [Endomicrobium sp.]|jgi:transcriptional regulator with XRE-family HTH domain|nr:helix-turn-helix domain-containing protein [Endomicrobium sp.]